MTAYDPRLDSGDPVERQQAELEALRTALRACRSNSDGEVDRLRRELAAAKEAHAGQLRNTLAFAAEAKVKDAKTERLRAALTEIAGDPTGLSSFQADLAKQALAGTYRAYGESSAASAQPQSEEGK